MRPFGRDKPAAWAQNAAQARGAQAVPGDPVTSGGEALQPGSWNRSNTFWPVQNGWRMLFRSEPNEIQFGLTLAFIAGAINAGGFMIVGQYTSHMSGIVSAMADGAAVGAWTVLLAGLTALCSFLGGAACSAILINWCRRHHARSQYALPLLLEALLVAGFGLLGEQLPPGIAIAVMVPLLCFLMGLQNATITKISGARIRTTHVTGIVTDIGIELGKLCYWNIRVTEANAPHVRADRAKLRLLSSFLGCFFVGGVLGAVGFSHIGLIAFLPLSVLLLLLASAVVQPALTPAAMQAARQQD